MPDYCPIRNCEPVLDQEELRYFLIHYEIDPCVK